MGNNKKKIQLTHLSAQLYGEENNAFLIVSNVADFVLLVITSRIYNFFLFFQMRNWKRRYFLLEENSMSYFKSDLVNRFCFISCDVIPGMF